MRTAVITKIYMCKHIADTYTVYILCMPVTYVISRLIFFSWCETEEKVWQRKYSQRTCVNVVVLSNIIVNLVYS